MNQLFVLDYSGTLTIFQNPADFVLRLRRKYPHARVVLYTGTERSTIDEEYPSLLALVDDLWVKPSALPQHIPADLDHLVLADDEPFALAAYRRVFRNSGIPTIEYLSPAELKALVP